MINQSHFKELLQLLEKNNVEYVLVGGYAVAFHGFPRFTKDLDVFFRNSRENVKKIKKALMEFGFPEEQLPDSLFFETGNIIQFGVSPLRIDILNEIDGVSFDEAMKNHVRGIYGDLEVSFIGLNELIKNKDSSEKPQDLLDAKKLKGIKKK